MYERYRDGETEGGRERDGEIERWRDRGREGERWRDIEMERHGEGGRGMEIERLCYLRTNKV